MALQRVKYCLRASISILDALILATGFTFGHTLDPSERLGATIKGRQGLSLKDYWQRPDSGTLLGVAVVRQILLAI